MFIGGWAAEWVQDLRGAVLSRWNSDEDREWWSRLTAWVFMVGVVWGAVSGVVIYGPVVLAKAPDWTPSLGALAGFATVLLGRTEKKPSEQPTAALSGLLNRARPVLLPLAATVFILFLIAGISAVTGMLLETTADWTGRSLAEDNLPNQIRIVVETPFGRVAAVLIVLIIVGVVTNFFIRSDKVSLHATFRDRLIRASLGASNTHRQPHRFTGFDPADDLP